MTRCFAAATAAWLVGATAATAQDATFKEIRKAVDTAIAPTLKDKDRTKVSFDFQVKFSTGAKVTAAAGISSEFAHCLEKHKIEMVAGETAVIRVVVFPVPCEPASKHPATRLTITLEIDKKSELTFYRDVGDLGDIAKLESLQFTVPPAATLDQKVEVVARAREGKPPLPPEAGTTKKTSDDGKVSVEMLVGETVPDEKKFKPAARALDAGHRVPVKEGESYMLRASSGFDHEIALSVAVDGLDWAHFFNGPLAAGPAKDGPKPRLFVVVPAKGTVTIKGWAKDLETSAMFDVARLPPTAAGRQGEMGVVSVRYAACWDKGKTPPEGEPKEGPDLAALGTKTGVEIGEKKVPVERVVGKFRGAVRLFYGDFAK